MPRTPEPGKGERRTAAEAVARARAAATPKLEKAAAEAGPRVEKAAQAAGSFLSTLRDRAKETARHFSEGYAEGADGTSPPPQAADQADPPARPRPRPAPGPRAD